MQTLTCSMCGVHVDVPFDDSGSWYRATEPRYVPKELDGWRYIWWRLPHKTIEERDFCSQACADSFINRPIYSYVS